MTVRSRCGLAAVLFVAGLAVSLSPCDAGELGKGAQPVRIGMVSTLFRDVPDSLIDTMAKPFGMLMATQTGLTGQLCKGGDAVELGAKLADGTLHLGIFHGHEFAWARQQHPDLKPLVIAVNQSHKLKAFLVVKSDSDIAGFADLKEKSLNVPKGTRCHSHLFVECRCQDACQTPMKDAVGKLNCANTAEEAIDEVVDGASAAAIVDNVTLDMYQRRKPGRFAELKIVVESETFPTGVVAYKAGLVDDATLGKFRDGLTGCHKTILGKQLLMLWKLSGFQAIPADYDRLLTDIAKAYPAPEVQISK